MRYDIPLRTLFKVYVDAESIPLASAEVRAVPDVIQTPDLISTFVLEPRPQGALQRPAFFSATGGFQLMLFAESFEIQFVTTDPRGSNMPLLADATRSAGTMLATLLRHFDRTAYRLALVQEGWLPAMNDEQADVIAGRLLKVPATFQGHSLSEWDWRVASRLSRPFGAGDQPMNTVIGVKRHLGTIAGGGESLPFDRVHVMLDVNTVLGEVLPRFTPELLTAFYELAPSWHEELFNELALLIGVDGQEAS